MMKWCRMNMSVGKVCRWCVKYGLVGLVWVIADNSLSIFHGRFSTITVFLWGISVFIGGELLGEVHEKVKKRKK